MNRRYEPPNVQALHTTLRDTVYGDVHRERVRAHAKHDGHGESMERKSWFDRAWLETCVEEVGEVARVLNEWRHGNLGTHEATQELRKELVQTAAMYVAWVDALDQDDTTGRGRDQDLRGS